jgi:hypothetical protein
MVILSSGRAWGGVLRTTPDGMVLINNKARAMHLVDLTGMGGREALLIYGMVVSYHQARVSSCQPEGPWGGNPPYHTCHISSLGVGENCRSSQLL